MHMEHFNRLMKRLVILAVIIGIGAVFVTQYSFIFAKTVRGEALRVERLVDPSVMVGGRIDANTVFAFAVAIRDGVKGDIYTSSSEDRQWAVVGKGMCVEAVFYPYPPWNLAKSRTYYNARLVQMYDCKPGGATPPLEAPASAPVEITAPTPGQ